MTQIFFKARCHTTVGQRVVITGSHPVLGSWDPSKSKVELVTDAASYPCWTGALAAPAGTDVLFKLAVLDRDGRSHWESKVPDRALAFPDADVQLSMGFDDARMETTTKAGPEGPAGRPDPTEARESPPPRSPPRTEAEPQRFGGPHELDRLVREALRRKVEDNRRAEIAEFRARRLEQRVQDADLRAAAAERLAAELQAKLALDELRGSMADLVHEVRAEGADARELRYAGYSPNLGDPAVFRRNVACSSAATSTCCASELEDEDGAGAGGGANGTATDEAPPADSLAGANREVRLPSRWFGLP